MSRDVLFTCSIHVVYLVRGHHSADFYLSAPQVCFTSSVLHPNFAHHQNPVTANKLSDCWTGGSMIYFGPNSKCVFLNLEIVQIKRSSRQFNDSECTCLKWTCQNWERPLPYFLNDLYVRVENMLFFCCCCTTPLGGNAVVSIQVKSVSIMFYRHFKNVAHGKTASLIPRTSVSLAPVLLEQTLTALLRLPEWQVVKETVKVTRLLIENHRTNR